MSISFRFRSRTQSQILDLSGSAQRTAGGIKAGDAHLLIAAAVGAPADEIALFLGTERVNDEEVIPFFSCLDIERCAPVKRAAGAGGPAVGGAMGAGGRGAGRGRAGGPAGQQEYVISATGEMFRVGRGGALLRVYQGRGGGAGGSAQQQDAAPQDAPGSGIGGGGANGASAGEDAAENELRRLQQRMGGGVSSVAIDMNRGRGRGRGGMDGGAAGGGGGGGGAGGNNNAPRGPPPPGYVCHNCGNGGHRIEDCPKPRSATGFKRIAPPDGIAESLLVPCAEDDPARCVTRDGRFVKRAVATDMFVAVAGVGGAAAATDADLLLAEVTGENAAAAEGSASASAAEAAVAACLQQLFSSSSSPPPATLEAANFLCAHCKRLLAKAVELTSCDCKTRFCSAALPTASSSAGGGSATERCVEAFMAAHDDEGECPTCGEPFFLDDVEEATTVREQIEDFKALLKKRPRE